MTQNKSISPPGHFGGGGGLRIQRRQVAIRVRPPHLVQHFVVISVFLKSALVCSRFKVPSSFFIHRLIFRELPCTTSLLWNELSGSQEGLQTAASSDNNDNDSSRIPTPSMQPTYRQELQYASHTGMRPDSFAVWQQLQSPLCTSLALVCLEALDPVHGTSLGLLGNFPVSCRIAGTSHGLNLELVPTATAEV